MGRSVRLWDDTRDALLRELWEREPRVLVKDIRAAVSAVSAHLGAIKYDNAVTKRAGGLGLSASRVERRRRFRRVALGEDGSARFSDYLMDEAARRAVTPLGLLGRLLRVIDRDRMVDAVLDDSHSIAPRAAARTDA